MQAKYRGKKTVLANIESTWSFGAYQNQYVHCADKYLAILIQFG